jgi:hypothetical protein
MACGAPGWGKNDHPGLVAFLLGGVRDDIQHNVVDIDTAALTSPQATATHAGQRRRELD